MCKEKRRLLKSGSVHQSVCGLCSCTEMRQHDLVCLSARIRSTAENDVAESRSENKNLSENVD